MEGKLKRGNVTTISVPTQLKERIDNLREDKSYHEFLADLVRGDIIEKLEECRAPGETYGDVILAVASGGRRDQEELELLLKSALSNAEVEADGTIKATPPWEKH